MFYGAEEEGNNRERGNNMPTFYSVRTRFGGNGKLVEGRIDNVTADSVPENEAEMLSWFPTLSEAEKFLDKMGRVNFYRSCFKKILLGEHAPDTVFNITGVQISAVIEVNVLQEENFKTKRRQRFYTLDVRCIGSIDEDQSCDKKVDASLSILSNTMR